MNAKRDENRVPVMMAVDSTDPNNLLPVEIDPITGGIKAEIIGDASGDVVGPASSTDNAIARFDGTTGKLIQNSGASIDDSGNITANNLSGTNTGDQDLSALALKSNVLELDNTDAFTPDADYEPATKKYVDDSIIAAGGGYATIQEEGTPLTQRDTINFIGSGITAADDTTRTNVTLNSTLNTLAGKSVTGSGDIVLATSPTLTTPNIGAATATSVNGVSITNGGSGALTVTGSASVSGSNTGDQDLSGYELLTNKSTDVSADGASNTKYPSVKAIKDYADGLVTGLLDYRGAYDASVNTFPASGGSGAAGAVLKGDMWIVSVAGTLGGSAVQIGDSVIASVDTPGQTASNWNILNSNISYVPEDVANKATTMSGNTASDIKYLSAKAIYDWGVATFAAIAGSISQAFSVSQLEIGHASDTTLTRVSAGVAAIEGKNIYLAGGTDVAVADGGTGVSSLAAKSILATEGADTLSPVVIGAGQSIRRNAGDTAFEAYTPSSGGFTSQVSVYLSAQQDNVGTTDTKILFNTENFDTGNEYDPTTNYRFTAGNNGYYSVNCSLRFSNAAATNRITLSIYKNGVSDTVVWHVCVDTQPFSVSISKLIQLNTNDYIEIYARNIDNSASDIAGGSTLSFLTIHRIA